MTQKKDEFRLAVAVLSIACMLFASCATTAIRESQNEIPETPKQANVLTSKTWYLCGYRAAQGFVSIAPGEGSSALAVFAANGTIEGTTGINQFRGTWKQGGDRAGWLAFSARVSASTRIEAPNEIAARFDRDIISLINQAANVKIEKDSIALADERNEILLKFIHF